MATVADRRPKFSMTAVKKSLRHLRSQVPFTKYTQAFILHSIVIKVCSNLVQRRRIFSPPEWLQLIPASGWFELLQYFPVPRNTPLRFALVSEPYLVSALEEKVGRTQVIRVKPLIA